MTKVNVAEVVEQRDKLREENFRLLGVMVEAIAAMNDKRYGDLRSILVKGEVKPLMSATGVLAGNGGSA